MRVVVTDADMLFGGTTRALFIYMDYADLVRLHWSQRILTEMSAALVKHGRKPDMDAALVHERLLTDSLEHAMVEQTRVDAHEDAMREYVRDPGDAHVAACAFEVVTGGYYPANQALVLTSRNVQDYKLGELAALGITVMHPDDFLMGMSLNHVAEAFRSWRITLQGQRDVEVLLRRLEADGTVRTAQALRIGAADGQFEL